MSSPIFDATFGTGRFMYEEPVTIDPTTSPSPEPQDVRQAFMQVLASLVAAVSLLKRGGNTAKKAAPSDKMFDQMILDYEKAIEQGRRAALAQPDAGPQESNAEPKQDVRQALELQLFDLVELARDTRSDKGGEAKWVHPSGALVKEFAKRIAALAQSDAGPHRDPDDTKVICPNCTHQFRAISVMEQARLAQSDAEPQDVREALADLVKWKDYKDEHGADATYELGKERAWRNARAALAQSDAGPPPLRYSDKVERAGDGTETRRLELAIGELMPDCPTEGVAARQGNGG